MKYLEITPMTALELSLVEDTIRREEHNHPVDWATIDALTRMRDQCLYLEGVLTDSLEQSLEEGEGSDPGRSRAQLQLVGSE